MSSWSPDWEIFSLRSIAEFRNGINYGSVNKGHGIKVIGVSNFKNYLYVPYDELEEINPEGVIRDEDLLQENDFVFVRSNGNRDLIGRSLYVCDLTENVTHSGFTIRLRFTTSIVYPEFFAQVFRSEVIRDAISNRGSGTNISNLSQQILGDLQVPIPPLPEQRKIAAILSTWDEAITLTEQLIAALQRRKQALMQLLLTGAVRFQEFEGEWEEVQLHRFFEKFSTTNSADEDLPILSSSKIHGVVLQSVIFDKRIASLDLKRYKVIEQGDLVYDPMLLWDASIGFLENVEKGVISPAYETLRFKGVGIHNYFRYLFKTHYFREIYKVISQGTNVRRRKAPVEAFLKISFEISTDTNEQERITEILINCDEHIYLNKELLEQFQTQKRGLMQQLLTGAVRVDSG